MGTGRRRIEGRTMNSLLTGKFPLATVLLLIVIMFSCTHENEAAEDKKQDPNVAEWEDSVINGDATMSAMSFNVGDVMSVERQEETRSTTTYAGVCTFSTGDYIAVAVTRNGASEVVKLYRVKSDGSLEYAGGDNDPFIWKSTGETVSIRA